MESLVAIMITEAGSGLPQTWREAPGSRRETPIPETGHGARLANCDRELHNAPDPRYPR